MRRTLSVLMATLGTLMLLVGTVGAAIVGPDDTLMIGEKQVPERAKGVAVRTHPEITRFVNIDLLVRAEAEGGVFLASSHRVDTDDLLMGRRYFEVTRMALGDVGGVVTDGPRATRKALRPGQIVGWLDQTTGEREAELVVELDGAPIDVVAVPHRGNQRLTFSIGAHVRGAFWTQVAVVVTGVLMLLVAWVLRRWPFRRGDGPGGPDGAHRSDDVPEATAAPTPGATGGRTPLSLPKHPGTAGRVAALLTVALVATGCAVPGPASEPPRGVTRTGMRLVEAQQVDESATVVYAPEFASYPMWALVGTPGPSRVRLMTRTGFGDRWQQEARVRVRGKLPEPVSRAIEPNEVLQRRADEAAVAIGAWWSTGEIEGVRLDRRTRRTRDDLLDSGVWPGSVWALDPPAGTPRVRVVEISGGHLVVARHTLMTPAPRRLTTIIHFPAATRPRVLGSSLVEVT